MSRLLTALVFLLAGAFANATTLSELVDADRLQIRSWVTPADNIVVGQQVKLTIEIATDRWFAAGTKLQLPEVAGLVFLQTEQFASNASEQRQGTSWVTQRWSVEIYPQREGNFRIPPIAADIQINNDSDIVAGKLSSPPLVLTALIPQQLEQAKHWVASPRYRISQSFDKSPAGLNVGDAITREILFEADDVMAMMLPSFEPESVAGLSAYYEPPKLSNDSNRGTLLARRSERITYIVESEGKHRLPAMDYFWWDTQSGRLQLLSLEATTITAGPAFGDAVEGSDQSAFNSRWFFVATVVLFIALAIAGIFRKIPWRRICLQLVSAVKNLLWKWRELRKPALPAKLNPGSSAAQ